MNDFDREKFEVMAAEIPETLGAEQVSPPEPVEDRDRWILILGDRRKSLSKDPTNVRLLNAVGEAAEKIGDIDRASWAYKRAIRIDPSYAQSYRNLSRLFQKQGRIDQARVTLGKFFFFTGERGQLDNEVRELMELVEETSGDVRELCTTSPACEKLIDKWHELGITPAEALYLLDEENSDGRDMMRFTLLDLLMRDVMNIDNRHAVARGGHYQSENLLPHERLYANYYARFGDSINLSRLVRSLAGQINRRFDLYKINYVRRALLDRGYVQLDTQRIAGIFPVQRYVLTEEGRKAGSRLRRLLKATGAQIDRAMKANPEQARAFIAEGGPAILLMESHPSGYFRQWLEILEQIGLDLGADDIKTKLQSSSGINLLEEVVKGLLDQ